MLLLIIYLAFISLGLPDSLLGSAWPVMYGQLNVPLSWSGIIFMIISIGTVISSLNSDRLNRKFGTGLVTAVSTGVTMISLIGFSLSHNFVLLCILAVPYGLGAGAIDAALNNYVALHYASRHMSWLHCMWGVGASLGPYIMSIALMKRSGDWHSGYRMIGIIQAVLTVILFATLSLWKKNESQEEETGKSLSLMEVIKIPGVAEIMISFFCYCALEQSTGLWAATWLVNVKHITETIAARFASLFYVGITLGRAISGFITFKLNDKNMVRLGAGIILLGILMLIQPFSDTVSLFGLVMVGLGCAPVYPSLIHSTPELFGREKSQSIIGIQMASAYFGTSFMPPLFGFISRYTGLKTYPLYLLIIVCMMIIMHEKLRKICK